MAGEKRTEVHTGDHRVPEEQQKYISGQGLHPSGRAPSELAYAEFILSKYVHAVVLSSHASIPLRTQAQPLTWYLYGVMEVPGMPRQASLTVKSI